LYLSALPFPPTQSKIFKKFAAKFPRIPRVVVGHVVQWPQMEKILHLNDRVYAVAISSDGRRIVFGSQDAIQMWDMETGEAPGVPFQGHTWIITSVAISLDGKHIVSGSYDGPIQVWDADTGKTSGAPLLGHEFGVSSVAITPDGNRIVSGSCDKAIRVWDRMT
jgi:WD40 repeat protein